MTLAEFALVIAGHEDVPEGDREKLLPQLARLALLARRAGVRPTLEQLAASQLEFEAWSEAGHRFEIETAQRAGLAAQGARGRALVQAELDGGDTADELLVHQAAEELAARDAARRA